MADAHCGDVGEPTINGSHTLDTSFPNFFFIIGYLA